MSLAEGASWLATEDVAVENTRCVLFRNETREILVSDGSDVIQRRTPPFVTGDIFTRAFDILFSVIVLVAVAPALLLLILALQVDSPGSVFFVQRRIGRNGVLFPCFKLRTMVSDAQQRLEKLLRESPEAHAEWVANH